MGVRLKDEDSGHALDHPGTIRVGRVVFGHRPGSETPLPKRLRLVNPLTGVRQTLRARSQSAADTGPLGSPDVVRSRPGSAMSGTPEHSSLARLQRERDLYRRLLGLGHETELEPFLKEALGLVVELTGARQGYLEIQETDQDDPSSLWWISHDCGSHEIEDIRFVISRGIIGRALTSGETVSTTSAVRDPEFQHRESVRRGRIEAVLCAPVGSSPPIGVVYLQGRSEPGGFSDDDRESVEIFARHLAPFADRLLLRRRAADERDPTRTLREQLRLPGLVGRSQALAATLRQVAAAAPNDVSVLLRGETGTGKSQLARLIHLNGPRAEQPFVVVDCTTIAPGTFESELFGHVRGAFTGALRDRVGRFEAADRGTVFLDEVAEIPTEFQGKLLRVIQDGEFERVGETHTRRTDVRVIAATNVDLEQAAQEGRFRRDLYYRLKVLPIHVPSLVERRDDVRELAAYFCSSACERHRLPHMELSPAALDALCAADWPGNVRELAAAVESAVVRAGVEPITWVERRHLSPDSGDGGGDETEETLQQAILRCKRDVLVRTLEATSWDKTEAARRLGIARSHVYNLIKGLGIEPPQD